MTDLDLTDTQLRGHSQESTFIVFMCSGGAEGDRSCSQALQGHAPFTCDCLEGSSHGVT